MKQILIEKNGVEHIMNIPDGSKVTIDGNVVVFEPKFKKGDIVYSEWETTLKSENSCIGIYDSTDAISHRLFVKYLDRDNEISFNGAICEGYTLRLANIFQKANLFAKLNKEGKQWNAEKLCIEDLKVVPKVGDYLKFMKGFVRILKVEDEDVFSVGHWITGEGNIVNAKTSRVSFEGVEYMVIPKDQFQSELAQLGFEYNFENDTISEIKWKPKEGDAYYYFNNNLESVKTYFSGVCDGDKIKVCIGNCFKTSELCQQVIDKIKQGLKKLA